MIWISEQEVHKSCDQKQQSSVQCQFVRYQHPKNAKLFALFLFLPSFHLYFLSLSPLIFMNFLAHHLNIIFSVLFSFSSFSVSSSFPLYSLTCSVLHSLPPFLSHNIYPTQFSSTLPLLLHLPVPLLLLSSFLSFTPWPPYFLLLGKKNPFWSRQCCWGLRA